jgi:hypothetical protein
LLLLCTADQQASLERQLLRRHCPPLRRAPLAAQLRPGRCCLIVRLRLWRVRLGWRRQVFLLLLALLLLRLLLLWRLLLRLHQRDRVLLLLLLPPLLLLQQQLLVLRLQLSLLLVLEVQRRHLLLVLHLLIIRVDGSSMQGWPDGGSSWHPMQPRRKRAGRHQHWWHLQRRLRGGQQGGRKAEEGGGGGCGSRGRRGRRLGGRCAEGLDDFESLQQRWNHVRRQPIRQRYSLKTVWMVEVCWLDTPHSAVDWKALSKPEQLQRQAPRGNMPCWSP